MSLLFLSYMFYFLPFLWIEMYFSWSVVQKSLPSSIGAKLVAIQLLYRKSSQPVRSNPSNLSSRAHIIRPSLRGSGKRMLNRMHKKTWCVYNPTMFLRLFSLERSLLDHTGSWPLHNSTFWFLSVALRWAALFWLCRFQVRCTIVNIWNHLLIYFNKFS